ncbi:MAG: hypothetical protein KAQ95_09560 [Candidatus Heimdallarchaeota archaeon]|nr:hypothetical protein [Candidatus Heimdallarchaeota archaeon]
MPQIVLRYLWMLFIGWWASIFWFLIGYLLIALVVTRQTGFWIFQRMGFVFSLQEPLEREIIFHKKIVTYIWFYLLGWFLGPAAILIAFALSFLLVTFSYTEKMVAGVDVIVIAD